VAPRIQILRAASVNAAKRDGERIGARRNDDQMHVVRQQAVSKDAQPESSGCSRTSARYIL